MRIAFDRAVPVLVIKIGGYPLSHSGLGAIRTLGRAGVPAYTITEDRFTPQAVSRFARGQFVLSASGAEPADQLVAGLLEIGAQLNGPAIALPTDDAAAILLAERSAELAPWFTIPAIAGDLPRRLASKRGLHEICSALGMPTPGAAFPATRNEVLDAAGEIGFPLMVKNLGAWLAQTQPVVDSATIVETPSQLRELVTHWPEQPNVMVQEYIPSAVSEDWIFHAYCNVASQCLVGFTGVKYRSWPVRAGVTSYARVVRNERLETLCRGLCERIGYRGILDLDWRYDARDDTFKLVDFNPRLGANFRLFENALGIDVVRALHLDLTGRPVPSGPAVEGRGLLVEHLDPPSRLSWRSSRSSDRTVPHQRGLLELAWFAWDDPLPFVLMGVRSAPYTARHVTRTLQWLVRPIGRVRQWFQRTVTHRRPGGHSISVKDAEGVDRAESEKQHRQSR